MPTYLSQSGLDELKREYQERVRETRRQIADTLSSAKELGDLSENFEYQDAKEQQALNESRIVQLEDMIHDAVIVEQTRGNDMIALGCTFVVEVHSQEKTYSVVGATEADPIAGKISNESPLGRALIGHRVGETIIVRTPNGEIEYLIVGIQ